jgi:hypothetical protein
MDLQSIPFNHSGTYPCIDKNILFMEPMEGIKPPTLRLQVESSIS